MNRLHLWVERWLDSRVDVVVVALAEHGISRGHKDLNDHCACGWAAPWGRQPGARHKAHLALMIIAGLKASIGRKDPK